MQEFELISGEGLEVKIGGQYQVFKGTDIRRHAVLAARGFKKNGKDIPISNADLESMAALLRSGALGPRRPVTIAHPDLASTPAQGWIISDRAEVGEYKGGKALYVGIEWQAETEQAILDKQFAYLSPVFTTNYVDQDGVERGPALLGAGLLNDPHWTDQTELWEQFASGKFGAQAGAVPADNQHERSDMEELEKAKAEISKLQADNAALEEDLKKTKTEVEQFRSAATEAQTMDAQVKDLSEKFAAAQDRVAAMEAERKQEKGDALIAKFQRERMVTPAHIRSADNQLTAIGQAAYDSPALFVEFAMALPVRENDNTKPVGGVAGDPPDEAEAVRAMATAYHDKHKGECSFETAVAKARQAFAAGKPEISA